MTEQNIVHGAVVAGTPLDASNTGRYSARLRAFAVTLGLGPVFVVILSLALPGAAPYSAGACVALAGIAATAARSSRVQFLWARLD